MAIALIDLGLVQPAFALSKYGGIHVDYSVVHKSIDIGDL